MLALIVNSHLQAVAQLAALVLIEAIGLFTDGSLLLAILNLCLGVLPLFARLAWLFSRHLLSLPEIVPRSPQLSPAAVPVHSFQ
jgi:hypothetical protein